MMSLDGVLESPVPLGHTETTYGAILCTVAVSSRQVLLFIQVDMQTSKPVVTVVSKIRHIKPAKNRNNLQAPKQRYVSKLRLKEKQTSI